MVLSERRQEVGELVRARLGIEAEILAGGARRVASIVSLAVCTSSPDASASGSTTSSSMRPP